MRAEPSCRTRPIVEALASTVLALLGTGIFSACSQLNDATSSRVATQYVDESGCAGCHESQYKAWTGSDHDLAMQEASERPVLGDFSPQKPK